MSLMLMGKKEGMTQVFDTEGNVVPCTAISIEENCVVQIKNVATDGYDAVQLGSVKTKKIRSKPMLGHFKKANIEPRRHLKESRLSSGENFTVGQEIGADYFEVGEEIDVTGISIGKGYQGVIKLHGFAGGPGAHGSGFHRHAGSTGMRSSPGRCLPGGKRASRMGGDKVTVQSLKVIAIDKERKLVLVKGAIPGFVGGLVYLSKAHKQKKKKSK